MKEDEDERAGTRMKNPAISAITVYSTTILFSSLLLIFSLF